MSKCNIKMLEKDKLITFSCDELREIQHQLKKNFREKNNTDRIIQQGKKDRMYEEYCNQIDNVLNSCKCVPQIHNNCDVCKPEDHEGVFCRCEGRNIKLASQQRKTGQNPWTTNS